MRAVTGATVTVACELSEDDDDDLPAAMPVLSEEELVERLKGEFGAREVFDDPQES